MITEQEIAAGLGCPMDRAQHWAAPLNAAMAEFSINTPVRIAAFMAQIGHESGSLRYVKEVWGPSAAQLKYERNFTAAWPPTAADPRNHLAHRLGNDAPGDGRLYMGRSPVQTTGKKNYRLCGEALGLDLVSHPEMLEHPETGARASAWFWKVGAGLNLGGAAHAHGIQDGCNLNDLADKGDFEGITLAINGGLNGYDQRKSFWASFKHVLGVA